MRRPANTGEPRVREHGRLSWLVNSYSRKGLAHLVDFEADEDEPLCYCEDSLIRKTNACIHVQTVICHILPELERLWPEHWVKRINSLIEEAIASRFHNENKQTKQTNRTHSG